MHPGQLLHLNASDTREMSLFLQHPALKTGRQRHRRQRHSQPAVCSDGLNVQLDAETSVFTLLVRYRKEMSGSRNRNLVYGSEPVVGTSTALHV